MKKAVLFIFLLTGCNSTHIITKSDYTDNATGNTNVKFNNSEYKCLYFDEKNNLTLMCKKY